VLVLLVMLSSRSFSQTVIQTETVDTSKVVLNVRVARLVYQDLLRYDGLKQEMNLMKLKFQKLEEREIQKDGIITILTQKDDNNQFIIGKKDEQLKLSKELTDSLHKELKGQRAKTFLWKVGTFTGLALTSLLLLSN